MVNADTLKKASNGKSKYDWVVLTSRCLDYESRLEGYSKELDGFRKREVMTTEEMKNNVEKLSELSKNLDQALTEFEVRRLCDRDGSLTQLLSCFGPQFFYFTYHISEGQCGFMTLPYSYMIPDTLSH